VLGVLHDRVVDGIGRRGQERLASDAHEIEVHAGLLAGAAAGSGDGRGVPLELGQIARGAEQEHAAVPQVLAAGEVLGGALRVRLFDESPHAAHRAGGERFTGANVAVGGFRARRLHAESDQLPAARGGQTLLDGASKRWRVRNHVVRRQHQQHGIVIAAREAAQRRQRHRRCGVAPGRLEQDLGVVYTGSAQLLGHQETVFLVAHHQRRRQLAKALEAQHGLLQQAVLAGQWQELLRVQLARQRPQAGAGAAGQDDGDDHRGRSRSDWGIRWRGPRLVAAPVRRPTFTGPALAGVCDHVAAPMVPVTRPANRRVW
jgi:hypothetical protein